MNLAIIGSTNNSGIKTKELKNSKPMMKIFGEFPIERIIRIARSNGIKQIFCLISTHEKEYKDYLSIKDFGIPLKLFIQDTENPLHSLFVMAPFLMKEPFFLIDMNTVFTENEFREFVNFSILQEDADGTLSVTRYNGNKPSLCVAMNDNDIIIKFSDSREGYGWAASGIYYFLPQVFNEMEYALQTDIYSLDKSLQLLIARGYMIKGFSFSKIINVETVADIIKAEELIRGIE